MEFPVTIVSESFKKNGMMTEAEIIKELAQLYVNSLASGWSSYLEGKYGDKKDEALEAYAEGDEKKIKELEAEAQQGEPDEGTVPKTEEGEKDGRVFELRSVLPLSLRALTSNNTSRKGRSVTVGVRKMQDRVWIWGGRDSGRVLYSPKG